MQDYRRELAEATGAKCLTLIHEDNPCVYTGIIKGRPVVIKLNNEAKAQNIRIEMALLRAFRRHPNLVTFIGHGEIKTKQGKPAKYLIEEFIEGQTLADIIDSTGALPWQVATGYTIQMCEFLRPLHCANIIYADVKPENVMVCPDDRLKFLDLGIVQKSPYTPKQVLGTPRYLCPDWVIHPWVDTRIDIYGLGIVLFEMLTGKVPFHKELDNAERALPTAEHIGKVALECRLYSQRPEINRDIPERLDLIYKQLVQSDRDRRYQTIDKVLDDLQRVGIS